MDSMEREWLLVDGCYLIESPGRGSACIHCRNAGSVVTKGWNLTVHLENGLDITVPPARVFELVKQLKQLAEEILFGWELGRED